MSEASERQKVEALQALNDTMARILHELQLIRQSQQAIAAKTR